MNTKLTLRISQPIIKRAKTYSKKKGKSLSQLVTDYFILITQTTSLEDKGEQIPPLTQALQGILRGKDITENDYKKYLEDKYL